MSPRVEISREHVIIQSVGVTILLDCDRLRRADQQTVSRLLAELGETSFDTWQRSNERRRVGWIRNPAKTSRTWL